MTGPRPWVDLALAFAALPVLGASGYLAALAAAARHAPPPVPNGTVRFDVVVPAHDEEGGVAATVASLLALDYPRERFRVIVVADNCTDHTAERARAAGARVLERRDAERRGKGYALAHAYDACLAEGVCDAVAVVDADTRVTPNLLRAFAARLAAGEACVQAEYGVRNAGDSWRTRLMAVAFACYHTVRSLARERLGLSCGLRGNGMAFAAETLRRHPHRAFSRVEDVEYGAALAAAGVRVAYAPEAAVYGDMPATADAARTQRERWEGGRLALVRRWVPPLLGAALGRPNAKPNATPNAAPGYAPGGAPGAPPPRRRVPLDLALDLLVPPLTTLAALALLGAALAAAAVWRGWAGPAALAPWAAAVLCLAAYVARGAALAGHGPRVLLDLLWGPAYAAWKLALAVRPRPRAEREQWVRTARPASPIAPSIAPPPSGS